MMGGDRVALEMGSTINNEINVISNLFVVGILMRCLISSTNDVGGGGHTFFLFDEHDLKKRYCRFVKTLLLFNCLFCAH